MGTRHLTAVYLNGQHRIAQYGQWDGYPSGQGKTVLEFLGQEGFSLEQFKTNVGRCEFIDDARLKDCWTLAGADPKSDMVEWGISEKFGKMFPQLSRNTGANVLGLVYEEPRKLTDSLTFAKDGLFCEYAYALDLDAQVLEVYKGFQKAAPVAGRFASMDDPKEEYRPVTLVKSYPFSALPTVEQMEADVDPQEDEEAA